MGSAEWPGLSGSFPECSGSGTGRDFRRRGALRRRPPQLLRRGRDLAAGPTGPDSSGPPPSTSTSAATFRVNRIRFFPRLDPRNQRRFLQEFSVATHPVARPRRLRGAVFVLSRPAQLPAGGGEAVRIPGRPFRPHRPDLAAALGDRRVRGLRGRVPADGGVPLEVDADGFEGIRPGPLRGHGGSIPPRC